MSSVPVFEATCDLRSMVLRPHNDEAKELHRHMHGVAVFHLAVFPVEPEATVTERAADTDVQRFLDALKAGFGTMVRAYVNPPPNRDEAECQLRASLGNLAGSEAEWFGLLAARDAEPYDHLSEEDRRRLDALAALYLLRRGREAETARRHAALVLDGLAAAATSEGR